VFDGDQTCELARHLPVAVVEHVGVASMRPGSSVALPRSITRAPAGYADLRRGTDRDDAIVAQHHDAFGQTAARRGCQTDAGANRDDAAGRFALKPGGVVDAEAGYCGTCPRLRGHPAPCRDCPAGT
jgi:hypothetical protein